MCDVSLYVHCVANTSFIHKWLYFIYRIYLEFGRLALVILVVVVVFSLIIIIIIFSYLFFMLARASEIRLAMEQKSSMSI